MGRPRDTAQSAVLPAVAPRGLALESKISGMQKTLLKNTVRAAEQSAAR